MQDQIYGLGGTNTGRVSAVAAEPDNPFASLINPALIAAGQDKRFSFSLSSVSGGFENPRGVILDSRKFRTRDGQPRSGTASIPQVKTSLWAAGYTHPFSLPNWPSHRAGFGFAFSGPFDQFRRWMALSPYDFTPLRYGAADTQFKGTFSASLELVPRRLFIGGGVSIFLTSAGIAEASLNTTNSTGRLAMDVGFNSASIFGLYSRFGSFGAALVYRESVNPVFHQTMVANVLLGGVVVMNQPVEVRSSLYFEPRTIELELQQNWRSAALSAGVSFQQWSRYEPRYLAVLARDANGRAVGTIPPNTPMRDTFNPRVSFEWLGFRNWRLSAGYQYRPTPAIDLSGEGNILDSDTHVGGASIMRSLGNPLFLNNLWLSVYGQAHWGSLRQVVKTSGEFVGAPGYPVSSRFLVFGASLTADI